LDGLTYKEAAKRLKNWKIKPRIRKNEFARCRFLSGELYYVNGLPQMIDAIHLPIEVRNTYQDGLPPLGCFGLGLGHSNE
jgi:leucyl-tRNA synthetase